jgi:hypothetical protein
MDAPEPASSLQELPCLVRSAGEHPKQGDAGAHSPRRSGPLAWNRTPKRPRISAVSVRNSHISTDGRDPNAMRMLAERAIISEMRLSTLCEPSRTQLGWDPLHYLQLGNPRGYLGKMAPCPPRGGASQAASGSISVARRSPEPGAAPCLRGRDSDFEQRWRGFRWNLPVRLAARPAPLCPAPFMRMRPPFDGFEGARWAFAPMQEVTLRRFCPTGRASPGQLRARHRKNTAAAAR